MDALKTFKREQTEDMWKAQVNPVERQANSLIFKLLDDIVEDL